MKLAKVYAAVLLSFSLIACAGPNNANEPASFFQSGETTDFTFQSNGLELSGVFDTPSNRPAKALILFVHGYGGTDIHANGSFGDLRRRFGEIGIASAVWDKPGQGRSEGNFDINQSVYDSAQEVVDAANALRAMNAPGSAKIGIWGISRAGWIAPLAIQQDPDLSFWISVSGVVGEDNFPYLLLSNLPHEGGSLEQAENLSAEWQEGCALQRTGASYDAYLEATQALRANAYFLQMRGPWQTRAQYEAQQTVCANGTCDGIDDTFCSYIYVPEFQQTLRAVDADVLALFGEKDLNVDWRKTLALYEETIGQNPNASLTTKTYPDADHNLNIAETGSLQEMLTMVSRQKSGGYYDLQIEWLEMHVLEKEGSE
ncbi:MAG: alpha/beta hydrolase [Pseudomonadota bacterium]